MRHKHGLPPSHRLVAEQLDLFGPPGATHSLPGPKWQQLPEETRETVTRLMARLLVDHGRGDRRRRLAGGRRDLKILCRRCGAEDRARSMGFRFRRRLRAMPGLRVNLSKSGASTSIGRRGLTLNLTRKSARTTVGIRRTGLSWRGRRVPSGDGYGSSAHTTGPGEIGMAAILAAALLILATVGILTIFAR